MYTPRALFFLGLLIQSCSVITVYSYLGRLAQADILYVYEKVSNLPSSVNSDVSL